MSTEPYQFSWTAIIAQKLYYGRFRRIFRFMLRQVISPPDKHRIFVGPLRGKRWFAHETSCALGVYEMSVQEQILQNVKPGDTFYDVGANRGFFSLLASHIVGAQGHVYSFEPFPDNLKELRKLFAENQTANTTVISKAVSQTTGTASMFAQSTGTQADGVMATLFQRPDDRAISIDTLTLDEFIAEHPVPNFVKMDIEGAEALALKGAQKLLARQEPLTWLIECHSEALEKEVVSLLQAHGYTTQAVKPRFLSQRVADRHILAWKK